MRSVEPRAAVVQPEQLNDGFDVLFTVDVVGNPTGFWMQVMQVGLACRNQLFPNPDGERQIGQPVSVQVSYFSPPGMEEDHSTAMRFRSDSRP